MSVQEQQTARQLDKWLWGVVVAMATIILTGGTMFMTQMHSQVQYLEAHISRQGERLAALEVQNTITDKRLERIEQKIDQLLSQGVGKINGH